MSHLESKVYARLTASTALAAIVAGRIWPMVLPQKTRLPAVSFQRVDSDYGPDLEGDGDLLRATIQVDCWALSYDQAKDMARAVRLAMSGATEAAGGFTAITVDGADAFEEHLNHYHASHDFVCWHRED